jgi:hypothetical protein
MRYLIKGDCGIPLTDPTTPQSNHPAWRRNLGRRILAILCLILAGHFGLQFLQNGLLSDHNAMAFTPEWDDPAATFAWFLGHLNGWAWQLRSGVNGALPPGNYGLILKMALCAVAAAVFVHSPRKN